MRSMGEIVEEYLKAFPTERDRLRQLLALIDKTPVDQDLFSRTNFVGHITASGIIVSRSTKKVLRVLHRTYRMYLQPGGHINPEDLSPLEAAIREIRQETSLSELEYVAYHYNPIIPIDIDTHFVPENTQRGELLHWHHDFRYLFLCNEDIENLHSVESDIVGFHWDDITELQRLHTFTAITKKIQRVLSREFKQNRFYDQLISKTKPHLSSSSIVVSHLLPDAFEYFMALKSVTNILSIIPKPKSIVDDVYQAVSSEFNVTKLTRDQVRDVRTIQAILDQSKDPFTLFDIGGWFAPIVNDLARLYPERILGIIEDTENGHQKYERLKDIPIPIFSVARSPLKDNEDALVGQSVLFSADVILRDCNKLIQYMDCSVLGYGKIGKSIAHHLLVRGVKPNVYDINPIRRLEAYNRGCVIPSREFIMSNSDVLFCATGSQSVDVINFRQLKPGCFIFSVTSSDDEFDITFLESEYEIEEFAPYVTKYSSFNNYFFLANRGNAVNFIHKAVVGDFIHLVRAEMIYAHIKLTSKQALPGIHEISDEERKEIASIWLKSIVDD